MRINSKIKKCQQQRIHKRAKNSSPLQFFNLLTSDELLPIVEKLLPNHRERYYPPTETLSMFLSQALNADRSCQQAVNDIAVRRIQEGLKPLSVATGAYSRARKRLPLNMIRELTHAAATIGESHSKNAWCWKGKSVYLIDGTTLSMPDTHENQACYPQQGGQKQGLGFPICRLLGIVNLCSGSIIDACIGRFNGKGSDEQTMLRSLLNNFTAGDVIVGDAFYGTYFLLALLQHKNINAVFEQMGARKRVTDFRKGKRLGTKDHLIELVKPKQKPDWMTQEYYDSAPDTLKLRELKVGGKILITTFLSADDASRDELKSLHKQRWNIEVDFRNLKTTMGMDTLSCKTPEMIQKEIWIYFLAYNLIRLLMAKSANFNDVLPRTLSFKHSLQLFLSSFRLCLSEEGIEIVLFVIAGKRIGNRSGRIEPRAIKRRPKAYPLLTKPRVLAREEVRENGQPKKLK